VPGNIASTPNSSVAVIETEWVVAVESVRTRPREERGSLVEQMLEDHGMLDQETRIVTGFSGTVRNVGSKAGYCRSFDVAW
jgi:hypothetical protein